MAKSVHDVAAATEAILDLPARAKLPVDGYRSFFSTSFNGLRLGFVDPAVWRFPPDLWVPSEEAKKQHDAAYHEAREKMQSLGAEVIYPVTLPQPSYEHEETANEFFRDFVKPGTQVHDLASVVEFNKKHAEKCLPKDAPDQSWLVRAVENRPSEAQYRDAFQHMLQVGRDQGLRKVLDEHNLDVVIAPMDSPVCSLSTASGYPISNVPLGRYHLKGQLSRPFGLAALARPEAEGTLIKFMSAFEANFPARVIPEQLLSETRN
ncbi:uncharacterized protein THITE_151705 [Thermothielavioides terrestris NRRL 8126]|uniref:Amidase domain-containing protein n=1 Tax=Thermothielavioides terrestris (strain ATCC 38088 / NRRL 8126) TaxID=578455 RepID=G2R3I0_THETT|nr:uncharacterized protein THITE_151705 [Thermothielavioides terrestris NRRL 8126]AEO66790.1 hypothetical protein THITE_151705 [Thermothielavioides terrestris NRRL 8126]